MAFKRHASEQIKIQQVNDLTSPKAIQRFRWARILDTKSSGLKWKAQKSTSRRSSTSFRNSCCYESSTCPTRFPLPTWPFKNESFTYAWIQTTFSTTLWSHRTKGIKIQNCPLQVFPWSSRLCQDIKLHVHSWLTVSRRTSSLNAPTRISTVPELQFWKSRRIPG